MDAEELLSDLEKFQLIKNIWLIIDSSIVKEYHATADEDTDPQNVVVHNYTQQSRQERWEQSGLIGKNEVILIQSLNEVSAKVFDICVFIYYNCMHIYEYISRCPS